MRFINFRSAAFLNINCTTQIINREVFARKNADIAIKTKLYRNVLSTSSYIKGLFSLYTAASFETGYNDKLTYLYSSVMP